MCHTEKTARRLGDDSKTQAKKVHKNSNDKMKEKTRKTRQSVSSASMHTDSSILRVPDERVQERKVPNRDKTQTKPPNRA